MMISLFLRESRSSAPEPMCSWTLPWLMPPELCLVVLLQCSQRLSAVLRLERVILDVGAKGITMQRRSQGITATEGLGTVKGYDNVYIHDVYDEHAIIYNKTFHDAVKIGDKVEIIPVHICPTCNLHEKLYLTSCGEVAAELPVLARVNFSKGDTPMKIALIQLRVDNSKQNNLDRACAFIAQSKQGGADMAILPEMFSCPYQTKNFPLYAEKAGGKAWLQFSETARKNNIYLVAGSMPEVDEEGKVYNTSFVFDRSSSAQLASHRKAHMFDIDVPGGQRFRESDTLTPGDKVTTFETEFGLMGLLVCYDFRFPGNVAYHGQSRRKSHFRTRRFQYDYRPCSLGPALPVQSSGFSSIYCRLRPCTRRRGMLCILRKFYGSGALG